MFLGKYKILFSGKNRIILPRKLRKELGNNDTVYLVKGLDGEIWGFDREEWQKQANSRLQLPINNAEGREIRREFFAWSEECSLDTQGRFILPQEFVQYLGIKSEVLIVGAGDHFEIWSPNIWEETLNKEIIKN